MKFKSVFAAVMLFSALISAAPIASADPASDKAALQQQLNELEKQIAQYESQLADTRSQKNTLANKIKALKTEQAKLQLQIQSTNILIDNLETQITATESSIAAAQKKNDDLKGQIGGTLFEIYQSDSKSMGSALAGDEGLSGFFKEIDRTQQLSQKLSDALNQVKQIQAELEQQNQVLEGQHQSATDLLAIKALQAGDLNSKLGEQGQLLAQTQGKEAAYTAILNDKKARAAQIRNQIYSLNGVSQQVTFGQALDIANQVSKMTGVRAAFLLAILTQETNLGKNVGTCNRAGDPPSKSWRVIMKPDRDQQPYLVVVGELGLNADTTPLSCPMHDSRGRQVGWGGAMGPAQFIPSTWMGYRDQVTAYTGAPANPWDIHDAFIAAAIKLKAGGATDGGNGEWNAAMRYFSGSTNTRFRFYGDNVIALANRYQADIDSLNQ